MVTNFFVLDVINYLQKMSKNQGVLLRMSKILKYAVSRTGITTGR